MEILPIDLFGIHLDIPFPIPLGFADAKLESFGAALCEPTKGLTLRPDQIRLKRWDDLFGYELSAQFFGDNGTLLRTADRIKFSIRNARTAGDWQILCDTLNRFYTLLDFPKNTFSTLSAHGHCQFPSTEERDAFLQRFSYSPMINRPAALGYVTVLDWDKDVRVMIEQSNVAPSSLFVSWDTSFINNQDWPTFLPTLITLMDNSANLFDLGLEPFRNSL
ncbi:MAG: hypothetical protein WCI46_06400 [Verrucomicrobiota bacterium]